MQGFPTLGTRRWGKDHPNQSIVEFDHVSFTSGETPVLEEISFRVRVGEMRILLGPTAAGKSVLLKLANGLLRPDAGTIRVFGEDIWAVPQAEMLALRQNIGMVFQEGALFDSLSVRENVAYQLLENRVCEPEIETRVIEALHFVDLEQAIDQFPPELSGGMRRRVAFARAIINDPELILYDSPTGGLDPVTSERIIELVIKQRDIRESSSLLVTQRLQDAFTCATHRFDVTSGKLMKLPDGKEDTNTTFLVLYEGKIIFDGSVLDLVHSQDRFIRSFLS